MIDAVVARIGAARTGIRLSPYGQLFDMPLHDEIDSTYDALTRAIGERGLAYVHLMDQSGYQMGEKVMGGGAETGFQGLLRTIRGNLPNSALILAGGLDRARAEQLIDSGMIDLAAFGAPFISNPDLVARLQNGWPLAEADRTTFYGGGAKGYIDYPSYAAGSGAEPRSTV